jgi:uncharacterized protein (DUF697 family)
MSASDATARVDRSIRRASVAAAALGVVLSPLPLVDEIALLPVYGLLTVNIARSRGLRARSVPWKPIVITAVTGLGARAAVNLTVGYIPVVAAAANAVSAVALTRVFGRYVDGVCHLVRDGGEVSPMGASLLRDALRPRPAQV